MAVSWALKCATLAVFGSMSSNHLLVHPEQDVLKPDAADPTISSVSPPALTYIPPVGLGLWLSKGSNATHAVEYALKAGYHHLDSAAAYDNEDYVGLGLSSSKLPRSAYWITSKLWNTAHRPSDVRPALEKTLSQLGIPYLDLYLIHWPVAFEPNKAGPIVDKGTTILDTWRAMEDLVRHGLTKHIGISNFAKHDVEDLLGQCKICPTAHEFESHPYLQQQDFVDFHHGRGIQVIAYSPLANINPIYHSRNEWPPILEDPFWVDIAKEKNVTPAQAILAWGIQRGTVVIPKSVHEGRIIENLASQSVRFNDEEMKIIAGQDKKARFNNPSKSWGIHLFDDLDGT